jgi:hypothetical protein
MSPIGAPPPKGPKVNGTDDEQQTPTPNQIAAVSGHRRPPTAPRAGAGDATPPRWRPSPIGPPPPTASPPRASSARAIVRRAPEESHEASVQGGAVRRPSRNVPPAQACSSRPLHDPLCVPRRGCFDIFGMGETPASVRPTPQPDAPDLGSGPGGSAEGLEEAVEPGLDADPGVDQRAARRRGGVRSGAPRAAGIAGAVDAARRPARGRRRGSSTARTASGGSAVTPGWRAAA